jgi:hypothetical protein
MDLYIHYFKYLNKLGKNNDIKYILNHQLLLQNNYPSIRMYSD